MSNKSVIEDYLSLQTCSKNRLNKMKVILINASKTINKDLTKLKLIDITLYLRELNNSDYKQWTKNDYKKIFKSFLRWYYKKDFFEWSENKNFKDGFKGVNKLKAFNKEKINKNTLLTQEELEKLLRESKSLKWKALLTLLYESAFRPCEIAQLKWKDLKFDDSRNLCSISTISPKTKERRTIPVRHCIVHLKRWREEFQFPNVKDEDYVFPSQYKRANHISSQSITTLVKRISKKAGLRNIFPYMFRHTRIYEIQKKLGSRISSKFAGHSIETSEIYNHLDSDDVEEAMLEKVYVTEELTENEENELKKEIERLSQENKKMAKGLADIEYFLKNTNLVNPKR